MSQPQLPINPAGDAAASFAARLPSQAWESLLWANDPQHPAWVWFKPPAVPQGLALGIPEETWRTSPHLQQLTLRRLLHAAGVDPSCVAMWQFAGMAYPGMNGANPLFDQPLPAPGPGVKPEIIVIINVPVMMMPPMNYMPPMAATPMNASAAPLTGNQSEIFERIDIEWTAVIDLERDLDRLRKMLVDLSARMKVLNRDLNPDERLYSSREDKQDWQDARRFLRDGENRLRACVKEFDIGDPSSAGYRRGLEHIYQSCVVPRVPFNGMESAVGQFEAHRKMVMTLQSKMNSTYLGAVSNGERRAQQILNRIAGKVREAGNKKTALGVVMDG